MPRKPRMYLPGVPCHVTQRGNNREACFFACSDNKFYLDCLADACTRYRVAVHAYVLMTNHVHLLMTPSDREGISRVMQSLGRRYVQTINKIHRRYGTLWQSRHGSSLVDAESYLLSCYRYIELNPVAAKMVQHPADYRWSSYRNNALGIADNLVTPHAIYRQLGATEDKCRDAYRALFAAHLDEKDIRTIRTATRFSMPVGDHKFKARIERALGREIGNAKRGRPILQRHCEDDDENAV
ncbi:MAG: putative transposase [Gammaproteobacteria bacterium]|jgi:putative transposase